MNFEEKLIELFNPFDVDLSIAGKQMSDGSIIPATGLVMTARICAVNDVKTDAPIHAGLVVNVTEGATVSIDGVDHRRYYATFPPDVLLAQLQDAFIGKYVYQVVRTATASFRYVRPILVTQGAHALASPEVL